MEMMENNESRKRPNTLLVLAILTIVNSGFSFLAYFVLSFFTDSIPQVIDILTQMGQKKEIIDVYSGLIGIEGWKFFIMSLCYGMAVVGAIFMIKLKIIGFHLYTISQILLFVVCNFIIKGLFEIQLSGIIFSVLVILLYASFFKYLKNGTNNKETELF